MTALASGLFAVVGALVLGTLLTLLVLWLLQRAGVAPGITRVYQFSLMLNVVAVL